ncbi:MAG: dynamin family protein [Burkholderiales bacterium]|nr:dynamin family protein [Burkholderiales bacterium]
MTYAPELTDFDGLRRADRIASSSSAGTINQPGVTGVGAGLLEHAQEYRAWRIAVRERVIEYADWLRANDLFEDALRSRFERLLEEIGDDRITIAVVGEFSRGKSELINALFADGFGRRLLPAFPGRSTMCPTELRWDPAEPPCIRLLPIESRASDRSFHELRRDPAAWTTIPIDPSDTIATGEALQVISQALNVPPSEARRYQLAPTRAAGVGAGGGIGRDSALAPCDRQLSASAARGRPCHPRHPGAERDRQRTRTDPQPAAERAGPALRARPRHRTQPDGLGHLAPASGADLGA